MQTPGDGIVKLIPGPAARRPLLALPSCRSDESRVTWQRPTLPALKDAAASPQPRSAPSDEFGSPASGVALPGGFRQAPASEAARIEISTVQGLPPPPGPGALPPQVAHGAAHMAPGPREASPAHMAPGSREASPAHQGSREASPAQLLPSAQIHPQAAEAAAQVATPQGKIPERKQIPTPQELAARCRAQINDQSRPLPAAGQKRTAVSTSSPGKKQRVEQAVAPETEGTSGIPPRPHEMPPMPKGDKPKPVVYRGCRVTLQKGKWRGGVPTSFMPRGERGWECTAQFASTSVIDEAKKLSAFEAMLRKLDDKLALLKQEPPEASPGAVPSPLEASPGAVQSALEASPDGALEAAPEAQPSALEYSPNLLRAPTLQLSDFCEQEEPKDEKARAEVSPAMAEEERHPPEAASAEGPAPREPKPEEPPQMPTEPKPCITYRGVPVSIQEGTKSQGSRWRAGIPCKIPLGLLR